MAQFYCLLVPYVLSHGTCISTENVTNTNLPICLMHLTKRRFCAKNSLTLSLARTQFLSVMKPWIQGERMKNSFSLILGSPRGLRINLGINFQAIQDIYVEYKDSISTAAFVMLLKRYVEKKELNVPDFKCALCKLQLERFSEEIIDRHFEHRSRSRRQFRLQPYDIWLHRIINIFSLNIRSRKKLSYMVAIIYLRSNCIFNN